MQPLYMHYYLIIMTHILDLTLEHAVKILCTLLTVNESRFYFSLQDVIRMMLTSGERSLRDLEKSLNLSR